MRPGTNCPGRFLLSTGGTPCSCSRDRTSTSTMADGSRSHRSVAFPARGQDGPRCYEMTAGERLPPAALLPHLPAAMALRGAGLRFGHAMRWARQTLDASWVDLIDRAWIERQESFLKARQRSDPDEAMATVPFIRYALQWSDSDRVAASYTKDDDLAADMGQDTLLSASNGLRGSPGPVAARRRSGRSWTIPSPELELWATTRGATSSTCSRSASAS